MKHTILLTSCLAFVLLQPARAQEPAAPLKPSQPLVEEYRHRALEYLKTHRPELKPDQLQLIEVRYDFQVASDIFPASECTHVTFLDPSSRTQTPTSDGGYVTDTRYIQVFFSSNPKERVKVTTDGGVAEPHPKRS